MERKIQNKDEWTRYAEEDGENTGKATGTEGMKGRKGIFDQ